MKHWQQFTSYKQRGEWVELQFMAQAAQRRFTVSKPWGDTQAYDVGIEHGRNFLRVQIKSTTYRQSAGYLCQFKPNYLKKQDYSLDQIDVFAAYVIPENAWYLIPAAILLGARRLTMAMLCPVVTPKKKACYRYECYREAWKMLTLSRTDLVQYEGAKKYDETRKSMRSKKKARQEAQSRARSRKAQAPEGQHTLAQDVSPG